MQKWLREMALCFSAGSAGALAKSGAVWGSARFAASTGLAAHLAGAQYPSGIYARIVWSGVAGFLFLLPLVRNNWIVRGLFWGFIAAALQIVVIPVLGHGGLHFALIPLLSVLALSCIWGLVTVLALRSFGS